MLFKKKEKNTILSSIGEGFVESVENCIDPVFSKKMVGDGYLFTPSSNQIFSPCDCEVTMVADTNHAVGLLKDGLEILIHIGIESVGLEEQLIEMKVSAGQKIKKGDLIATIKLEELKKALPSIQTPVLVTNMDGKKLATLKEGNVNISDEILEVN